MAKFDAHDYQQDDCQQAKYSGNDDGLPEGVCLALGGHCAEGESLRVELAATVASFAVERALFGHG